MQDESQDRQAAPVQPVVIPGPARRPATLEVIDHQPSPQASERDAIVEPPKEPIGARAQQAILEETFAAPEPVAVTPPIERSEFQSARDSAANWRLLNGPPAGFWERVIRDVSIFTIVFAALVFVILQTM